MKPARKKLPTIYKGASWRVVFGLREEATGTPINLTGCTFEVDFRTDVSDEAPLLTLSSANGRITLGGAPDWLVTLAMPPAETQALTFDAYVYDLRITHPDNTISYPFYGSGTVQQMVTRDD